MKHANPKPLTRGRPSDHEKRGRCAARDLWLEVVHSALARSYRTIPTTCCLGTLNKTEMRQQALNSTACAERPTSTSQYRFPDSTTREAAAQCYGGSLLMPLWNTQRSSLGPSSPHRLRGAEYRVASAKPDTIGDQNDAALATVPCSSKKAENTLFWMGITEAL